MSFQTRSCCVRTPSQGTQLSDVEDSMDAIKVPKGLPTYDNRGYVQEPLRGYGKGPISPNLKSNKQHSKLYIYFYF